MDLFSPRPEHTQLDKDTINPKNKQLAKKIPSTSFNAITSIINKTDSSAESDQISFLLPPLPLHTRSTNNQNLDIVNVPNPVNLSSPPSTNLQENGGFPSPPQSPKLSDEISGSVDNVNTTPISSVNEKDSRLVTGFNFDKDIFLVKPNWNQELLIPEYKRSTRRFISQYRIFKDKDKDSASMLPSQRGYKYSLRNNKYKGVSNENSNYYHQSPTLSEQIMSTSKHTASHSNNKKPDISKQRKKSITKTSVRNTSRGFTSYSNNHTTPNINWELLPDYSPSWDTLPTTNTNKSMKVEWKGSIMDLSNDMLRDKLHPAELYVAQILRLPCSLYLDSKRRLFMSKVERMRQGLPFRRTDAQKACHIDVNKASRLYSAYEKVGWLDDKLFTKYL